MQKETTEAPKGVWLASGGVVALLLAVSGRYGFHRDELYFIVAGRNLDWGFVDQPPLTPLIARVSEALFGTSPTALRVLPAVAVGVVAWLTASMARQFGAGRVGQAFAAFSVAFAGVVLGIGHLLSTAVFDFALWALCLWLLIRILRGGDPRLWLGLGATVGVGLLNKHLIAFLAVAILVGLVATSQRIHLASVWPWLGVAVALTIAAPNLVWQAANGWPQLEMAEALSGRSEGPLNFILFQPLLLSIALAIPAGAGFWWIARSEQARVFRPIAVAFGFLVVLFLVTGGKNYYVAPMYSALLAAGGLWFERLVGWRRNLMAAGALVGVAVGMLIALPIMPRDNAGAFDLTGELGETVGWPDLVEDVAGAVELITPEDRQSAVVFTVAYGEAGAVDVLGPQAGLPRAVSGHNNYWLWGPPSDHGPIVGVGNVEGALAPICPDLQQVGTLSNEHQVENEVLGQPLWLCLEPNAQLADIWDAVRHFN